MCTKMTLNDFVTVHHEMGHVEYYLMYRNQPMPFRGGANPAFHEAVGDTIALSVASPSNLYDIGLMDDPDISYETDMNLLMETALYKIAFLPFGLLLDLWRWEVFQGNIKPQEYNQKWWEYRYKYQGIHAPVERSERDFDPGTKYHVPSGVPYIRYFLSYLLQFDFHRALCREAGSDVPLHRCSIKGSKRAGAKFRKMLQLGSSKPWQDAKEVLTGTRTVDTSAIKEFFQPLLDWLATQNAGHNVDWEENE